jgi:GNAT superfamily N-acetyltransferase
VDAEAVGSARLVACDVDRKPYLSPWLAGVYVLSTFRRRGIASALVPHALAQARRLDVRHLYLGIDRAGSHYIRFGWRPLAEEPYTGKTVAVMVRGLTGERPHAADRFRSIIVRVCSTPAGGAGYPSWREGA